MSDTALAIEAAQRLADYALEHGAAEDGVTDDLRLVEEPIRLLQTQQAHPILEGWQILNGWIVEPPIEPERYGDEPIPLFRLDALPGYREWLDTIAPPAWSYTPEGHDDEYEYVRSGDCDGSNLQAWRRTPERRTPRGDAEPIDHLPAVAKRRLHEPVLGERVRP